MRELGYLDKEGRAFLPDEALVRNTGERSRPSPPSESRIGTAIARLLSVRRTVRPSRSVIPVGNNRPIARTADPVRHRREVQQARSLLFVATTRARDSLDIFWHGTPSPFLAPLVAAGR